MNWLIKKWGSRNYVNQYFSTIYAISHFNFYRSEFFKIPESWVNLLHDWNELFSLPTVHSLYMPYMVYCTVVKFPFTKLSLSHVTCTQYGDCTVYDWPITNYKSSFSSGEVKIESSCVVAWKFKKNNPCCLATDKISIVTVIFVYFGRILID